MGKKKRNTDDEAGEDIGIVMTVSLFLILLTFFILLNSIAVIDDRKSRVALGSLLGAFGTLPGGLSPMKTGESIMPPTAPMIEEELNIAQLMLIMDNPLTGQVRVAEIKFGQKVTIGQNALFVKDTETINPEIVPVLDRLCEKIRKGSYPIEIVGHTDNVPAKEKGFDSNWEVSTRMALRVLEYVTTRGGIDAQRVTAYGCGSHQPVESNSTRLSRQMNRRVEIHLSYKAPVFDRRIYQKRSTDFFTYRRFNFKIF